MDEIDPQDTANTENAGFGTSQEPLTPGELRLRAGIQAARFFGVDLDIGSYRAQPDEPYPSPAAIAAWLRENGLTAKAVQLKWAALFRMREAEPLLLMLRDGSAGVLVGADKNRDIVWIKSPTAREAEPPVAIDRLRLEQAWSGDSILVRRPTGAADGEALFTLGWITQKVLLERKFLGAIALSAFIMAILSIVPALLVMIVISRVLEYNSMNSLLLVAMLLVTMAFFEALLGWAQREVLQVLGMRLDTLINLHVFSRLLSLPLEFFERSQAGETIGRIREVYRIREFLTGKVLGTILDGMVLLVLGPVLFFMEPTLAIITFAVAGVIAVIIIIFLPSLGRLVGLAIQAEHRKGAVLAETIYGIRTVKSLALEPQQKALWDARVADASQWRLAAGRLANWPTTLTDPLQLFMSRGVLVFGAFLAMMNTTGVDRAGLIVFMMLSGRVASPLVAFAKLMQDYHEARTSVAQVAMVLNNPTETRALTDGMRPKFEGRISFQDLTFTYPLGSRPALNRVSFDIPPGTALGLVGRSGSGKSTITRLLQGINREYTGAVRIDGIEMRDVNLAHLRRSFGVVLQDNFLFRGTIRENIIAGRPGLTLEDAVRAARLAGAEEFIERMPQGYDTWIEEGSTNISGGQRQRLAIARAVVTNPRIMILDEATSALDPESEALVNANLERIGKGRTMVVVSHRLSSLVNSDLIMVLDQGMVIDVAPHTVLLERCAIYRTLWNQQNRHIASARVGGPLSPMPTPPALTQGD